MNLKVTYRYELRVYRGQYLCGLSLLQAMTELSIPQTDYSVFKGRGRYARRRYLRLAANLDDHIKFKLLKSDDITSVKQL